ncbi:MAG: type II toxin-antitoxin system VapC family toxin [Chloroflexota bacterium]
MGQRRWTTTTSTAELRRVFVDTSAWLALVNRKDRFHEAAAMFHRNEAGARRVATWGILSETYTWLRYHIGYPAAERWLYETAALEARGLIEVIYPDPSTEPSVRRILARFADQDLSYVDAFSLVVAESHRGIDAIFAFDHHLSLSGLPVLPGPVR